MRASIPFGGGECRASLLEKNLQHHGHKEDPIVKLGNCCAIGEKAQVILMGVRGGGAFLTNPARYKTTRRPWALARHGGKLPNMLRVIVVLQ